MKIAIKMELENELINKDKNRVMLHLIKQVLKNYDTDIYEEFYSEPKQKGFTFSAYLGKGVKFLRDHIFVRGKQILLNMSSYDVTEMLHLYNAFKFAERKAFLVGDNAIIIKDVWKNKEVPVSSKTCFKAMSPIVVREHNGNNKDTWYHDIETEKGFQVFKDNLSYQIKRDLSEDMDLDIKVIGNKTTNVKFYDIVILSNLSILEIEGKQNQIEYIYKAGIGSKRNSGFGLVDVCKREGL